MWHGFLPGGIQPGGGLALPGLTCHIKKGLMLKWIQECLSPAFY